MGNERQKISRDNLTKYWELFDEALLENNRLRDALNASPNFWYEGDETFFNKPPQQDSKLTLCANCNQVYWTRRDDPLCLIEEVPCHIDCAREIVAKRFRKPPES